MKMYAQLLASASLLASLLLNPAQAQLPPPSHSTQNPLNTVFEQQLALASELMAVVSEDAREPRSIGSYTVKIYAVTKPRLAFDRFIAGLVRSRDGIIETASTVDINLDGDKELVVVIRSAGSGGYLSADAFDISRSGLRLMASVSELPASANPVSKLTEKIRKQN
jgi:hypothetical protein